MRKIIRNFSQSLGNASLLERISFVLLLSLVILAPIPYGGVMAPGALKIQLLSFATAAVAVAASRGGPSKLPLFPLAMLSMVAAVGAFQLAPLPDRILDALSPESAAVYAETNSILRSYGRPPVPPRISIAPAETVRATLLVLAYVCAFVAASLITRLRAQRKVLATVLLINCSAHALYATLWDGGEGRVHGAFVNANHLAGYLEIGVALAVAMLWLEISRSGTRRAGEEIADVLERRLLGVSLRVLAWVVLAAGIAFTGSRMGIAAAAATTATVLLLGIIHRASSSRKVLLRGMIAVSVLAAGTGLLVITGGLPIVRFLASDPRDPSSEIRVHFWGISKKVWEQYPHFGSGLGTFREAFRALQPSSMNFLLEQAHNDTIQLLVTGGWVSVFFAVLAIGWFVVSLGRNWWRQTRASEAPLAVGALGALISLLLHGLVEFNFSIPAIPVTLAILLGAGWSAATENEHESSATRSAAEIRYDRGNSARSTRAPIGYMSSK